MEYNNNTEEGTNSLSESNETSLNNNDEKNIIEIITALTECNNELDDSSYMMDEDDLTNPNQNALEYEKRILLSDLLEYILTYKNLQNNDENITLRRILGNVSSDNIAKLGNLLSNAISHRINTMDLLPGTMDEEANDEVMNNKKIAMTISKLSLLAANIYSELIQLSGSFVIVNVGALSSLAALSKRWGIECRGRECERVFVSSVKRTTKVRFSMDDDTIHRKRKKSASYNHPFITEEEDISPSNIIDYYKEANPKNTESMLIYIGYQIASSLSSSTTPHDFKSWSSEAREAYIDTLSTFLSITSSLLSDDEMDEFFSTCEYNEHCDSNYCSIVQRLSICIKQCCNVEISDAINTPTSGKRKRQNASSKSKQNIRKETIIYALRGIYPILTFNLDLPNGQKGKLRANDINSYLLQSIVASVSKDLKHMDNANNIMFDNTPVKKNRKKNEGTSNVTNTPISTSNVSRDDTMPTVVPPSLKKSNRNASPKPTTDESNEITYPKPRDILSPIIGFLQKLCTFKELEKAKTRSRIISIVLMCLTQLPQIELSYFVRFVMQSLCISKISRLRLFSTELSKGMLLEIYSGDEEVLDDKRTNDGILCMEVLKSLHGRLTDSAPVVRVRAAQSLSDLLKEVLSNHMALKVNESNAVNTQADCNNTLTTSITHLSVILAESLRRRALGDDKATVRRAAISGLVSVISLSIQFINDDTSISHQDGINVLRQLCNDSSVMTRRAAAEGVTTLLSLRNKSFGKYKNLLISSFANQVLPLILDSESTCSSKAIDLLRTTVLEPIWNETMDNLEAIVRSDSMIAWKILYSVCQGCNEAGSPKVGFTALKVAFKYFMDNSKIPANHLKQLLYETKNVAIMSLDATIENDDRLNSHDLKMLLSSSWGCLECITASFFHQTTSLNVKSKTKELYKLFKSSFMDGGFFLDAWKKINVALTNPDLQEYHQKVITGGARACLSIIGKIGICFSTKDAEQASEIFQNLLTTFQLPIDLIWLATSSLIAMTENISEGDTFREACAEWMKEILSKCEEVIEDFISRSHKYVESDKEYPQVERAVHTVGLINLIGFNVDENSISNETESNRNQSTNSLVGFHVKPELSLIQLIQTLLPPSLPSMQMSNNSELQTPSKIRALSFITLGKLALRDGDLAKECVNMLVRELKNTSDGEYCPDIQSNVLMVLGDLCIRYTNIVDKELPLLGERKDIDLLFLFVFSCMYVASCLQARNRVDKNGRMVDFSLVRKHAVLLLSSLLLQDFIKWRGLLLHRFLVATVDEYTNVSKLAEMTLSGPLLNKSPNIFLNNFVESVFVLNGCKAHPIYATAASSGDSGAGHAVNFDGVNLSGASGKDKRVRIYNMMLSYMTDESKIAVTARLTKEVLGAAIETEGDLADACKNPILSSDSNRIHPALVQRRECATNVFADTFSILTCPLIRVGKQSEPESHRLRQRELC